MLNFRVDVHLNWEIILNYDDFNWQLTNVLRVLTQLLIVIQLS
jgi:hypothetical protein